MNRLDHLVLGARDLDAAVDDLARSLGVRAGRGGRHPGLGTHNALLSLGDGAYLEVIAPDPAQPAPARRPFGLDALEEPHLVAWAVGCGDIEAGVARARERGYDPGDPVALERATPEGAVLRWRLTPREIGGGPVPLLIEWGETPHPARSAPPGLRLLGFRLEHPDPAWVTARLAALDVEGVPVTPGPRSLLVATLDGPTGTVELR